jgi:hypothetical protein
VVSRTDPEDAVSEPFPTPDAEDPTSADERVDELTETWQTSPLTDPLDARDPGAKPIDEHGDTPAADERTGPGSDS